MSGFAEKLAKQRDATKRTGGEETPPDAHVSAAPPESLGVVVTLPVAAPPQEGKPEYSAFGLQKPEQGKRKAGGGRFRIHHAKNKDGDRPVDILSFSYLVRVRATNDRLISLIFTHAIITLEGRNLGALLEPLEDETIEWLQCFDVEKFSPPAAGDLVINRITEEE